MVRERPPGETWHGATLLAVARQCMPRRCVARQCVVGQCGPRQCVLCRCCRVRCVPCRCCRVAVPLHAGTVADWRVACAGPEWGPAHPRYRPPARVPRRRDATRRGGTPD